jgi:protein-disulfide isomerase
MLRIVLVAMLLVALERPPASAQAPSGAPGAEGLRSVTPAAVVGDDVITLEHVQEGLAAQLARLERQRHELMSQRLEVLIGERLLAREAQKRGVTVEELIKREVHGQIGEATDTEVTAFIAQNRATLPPGLEAELRLKVRDHLRAQKTTQRLQAYVRELRAQTPVTVYLVGPRVAVNSDRGFAQGAQNAPVAIVEFSDFQCPFCKGVVPTVKQLVATYPGRVKWVFRDFPIDSLHPAARTAHEAARCAGDQGKFWEYHDLLFERAPNHSPQELKAYAQEVKLDVAAFAQCLDGGQYRDTVVKDVEEGERLGVSGTPTFFINGRPLVGNQTMEAFKAVIEQELTRVAH